MVARYDVSIFLFTRDLRLDDNSGLLKALRESKSVIPLFIFNPKQAGGHEYFSSNAFQFMITSLEDLDRRLHDQGAWLNVAYDTPEKTIAELIERSGADALFMNKDYTPFAKQREEQLCRLCEKHGIECHIVDDHLLQPSEQTLKQDGTPYTVFTPFFRNAKLFPVRKPRPFPVDARFYTVKGMNQLNDIISQLFTTKNEDLAVNGGRTEALEMLKNIKRYNEYDMERDFPALDATTKLSAHHKFGNISIRESYRAISKAFGNEHPLVRQLYWRDFFTTITYHFPHVMGETFKEVDENGLWNNDVELFKTWCNGMTGFPIVDAGMRELVTTGYMHNRVRMIVSSFLTKDLHIDWRWGEKFFAKHLVDYDPAVNNGSWQWAASTGCDAQPYFRIFNPWRQQVRFDKHTEYITKWLPELSDLTPKQIHDIENTTVDGYPKPVVNHTQERDISLTRFKLAMKK
ncbi:MAG: cryptochrome/photolyase family protein [Nanobdellota archaeon]